MAYRGWLRTVIGAVFFCSVAQAAERIEIKMTEVSSQEWVRTLLSAEILPEGWKTAVENSGLTESSLIKASQCAVRVLRPNLSEKPMRAADNRVDCTIDTDRGPRTLSLDLSKDFVEAWGTHMMREPFTIQGSPANALYEVLRLRFEKLGPKHPVVKSEVYCDYLSGWCFEDYFIEQISSSDAQPLAVECSKESDLTPETIAALKDYTEKYFARMNAAKRPTDKDWDWTYYTRKDQFTPAQLQVLADRKAYLDSVFGTADTDLGVIRDQLARKVRSITKENCLWLGTKN